MDDSDTRLPAGVWPDAWTAMVMTADPSSAMFQELIAYAMRVGLDTPDALIASADVETVVAESGLDIATISARLHAPPIFILACVRGWHRLGLRGLALMAEALEVPLAAFFLDADGERRPNVRRYSAYRTVAPRVTILGGDGSGLL
jgi:hypothetical protein